MRGCTTGCSPEASTLSTSIGLRPTGKAVLFSTDSEADFFVAPLEIRSIFPQELPLLLALGGLRVVERFGDWSRVPIAADAALQLCVCEPA